MARVTTSSFTYITKHRPNQQSPVRSVVYDGSDRPTSIVYNIAQQGGTETINIDWTTGHPTIGGVEFVDHVVNIWEARLELVVPASITGTVPVVIELGDGFSTQQVDVGTSVVQIVNTSNRISVAIRNWSDPTENIVLYLAENASVLTDGWPLIAGEGTSIDLDPNVSLYLVASTGVADTRILEVLRS